jgi:hypothetical protein
VKTKYFYVSCGCNDNCSVIITVLETVAKKRLLKTEDILCAVVTVTFGDYNSVRVL